MQLPFRCGQDLQSRTSGAVGRLPLPPPLWSSPEPPLVGIVCWGTSQCSMPEYALPFLSLHKMATEPIIAFETRLHKQYPHLSSVSTTLSNSLSKAAVRSTVQTAFHCTSQLQWPIFKMPTPSQ